MMKLLIHIGIVALILLSSQLHAQAPQGINYQGVARGLDGQPLANKYISIRISILNESSNGPVEYEEVHEVKTNSFGLFTLVIGQGSQGTTDFSFIGWTTGPKWLQIEMDENGGSNFKLMGSQQLMSVPYALYAERSGNGYQAGQGISISNNTISNTGDGDASATNELQDLSQVLVRGKDAAGLTIENVGTPTSSSDAATKAYVDAHVDGDASDTNEIQNLSQVLTESNNAGGNIIANLGTPTSSSDAATKAYVDSHADGDASDTNEIQDLSLISNTLKITNNIAATSIDLSPYLDDTDNQNLSSIAIGTDRQINISGGTSTTIDVADDDNNATNEAQTISRAIDGTVTLTSIGSTGGGSFNVNDADGNAIINLSDPTNAQDAATKNYVDLADIALGSRISNTFAFKSNFQFVNSTGSTLNNQEITLDGDEFGDFTVIFGNTFVAPENGIYLFVVEGNFSGANTGGRISISANGIKTNISIVTSYNTSTTPNYSGSFLYKLNAGEIVKLVGDNVFVGDSFTGRFSGFKL